MRTKKLRMLAATAATALGMLAFASPALAGDWTVNSVADDSDADLCADADCTLREAIRESASTTLDDTISFAPDVEGEIVLTSALPELSDVEIRGPGARDLWVRRSSAAGTPQFGIFAVGTHGKDLRSDHLRRQKRLRRRHPQPRHADAGAKLGLGQLRHRWRGRGLRRRGDHSHHHEHYLQHVRLQRRGARRRHKLRPKCRGYGHKQHLL